MKGNCEDPFKLSVFIGSPKKDLENIRQRIIQAVLEAGHIPDGMEIWASDARPTLKTIAEKMNLCDIHVVVLGLKYGEVLDNENISFTEWEYRKSRNDKRPIISFLLEENIFEHAWVDDSPDDREKKDYRRLWSELRKNSVCKLYKSINMSAIDRDVINALNQVIDSYQLRPLAGWIRAESKAAKLAAALQDNSFLMRVMDRVVRFRTTGGRFEKESSAKKAAAEMFWDTMMNQLARANYYDIFLESGSSLAYVSEILESKLDRQQGWNIATNNALSLLQLLLFTDGDIKRNPPVAPDPEDPYGAIFTHKCKQAYEEPHIKPRNLYEKEIDAVNEIIGLLKQEEKNQIILATASGWDTEHSIKEFRGPHVGSHPNMLFKRAIFMTGEPVVLFLSRHKVDPRFREAGFKCRNDNKKAKAVTRYCYPVFGYELPLIKALMDMPLALCIGYEKEKDEQDIDIRQIGEKLKKVLSKELRKAEFDMDYGAKEFDQIDGVEAGALMVANKKFKNLFPR